METKQILEIWNKLPFSNFEDEDKKAEWRKYALELLLSLNKGNTGLIADTGTGKTIMALLVFEAMGIRTLFLAPTVILTKQHADLYKAISGSDAVIVTGQKVKRDWNQKELIIATPHVFLADRKKGLINEGDFDLLIVDEMHKGQGNYPYVSIANLFNKVNKKILCLSASPGANHEEISWMEKIYQIKTWVTAEIEKPLTKNRLIKAELSDELKTVAPYFKKVYLETLKKLCQVFEAQKKEVIVPLDEENPFLTQVDNDKLEKLVDALEKPEFYEAKYLFAKQYKLSYLYRILMTEGYASFLNYICLKMTKDQSKAALSILNNNEFRAVYSLIKETQIKKLHPKEEKLLEVIKEMSWKNKSMLIFVSSKLTAKYLSELVNSRGYKSDVLFGGKDKSLKNQSRVIEEFSTQKLQIIFATSVVEEGLSLPDIEVVIHYNQPSTEIARLQRNGRTGRFHEGLVVFLITDIPYENALYFATLAKLKKMKSIFYESARQEVRENKARVKKRKVDLTGQLTLMFTDTELLF
ncbi:MAG: helicase-related protein [Patescibacteria group bacterium]